MYCIMFQQPVCGSAWSSSPETRDCRSGNLDQASRWTGALAHLGVAWANALQSRISRGADAAARLRSLAAYKDFLTLWKDADPDIPS
jgi:hypothetical protein